MFTIEIVSKRDYKGNDAIYVGRPSPLGNPFTAAEDGRDAAIARFKDWLNLQWSSNNRRVCDEIIRLKTLLIKEESIKLMCWCSPKPCHADVIAKAVINLANKEVQA